MLQGKLTAPGYLNTPINRWSYFKLNVSFYPFTARPEIPRLVIEHRVTCFISHPDTPPKPRRVFHQTRDAVHTEGPVGPERGQTCSFYAGRSK